jgi:DNA-3-methyladenine glycosylase
MFWEGGHVYVYFTYGMHFCANVVTGNEGTGEAVLIRAVEPLVGIELMTKNRFPNLQSLNHQSFINLTNGPAKFCKAFGLARQENGLDLLGSEISITDGEPISPKLMKRSQRIGIQRGTEKKWRFFINGNPWVSRK